jgi:hypothetical protein
MSVSKTLFSNRCVVRARRANGRKTHTGSPLKALRSMPLERVPGLDE